MNARVWAMLVLLSILWGGSFFFVGVIVTDLPSLTIVTLRVGIASMTLWVIALMIGLRPPKQLGVWGAFLGMGLLNNVIPFALIVWGQTQIASGLLCDRWEIVELAKIGKGLICNIGSE